MINGVADSMHAVGHLLESVQLPGEVGGGDGGKSSRSTATLDEKGMDVATIFSIDRTSTR